MNVRNIKLVIKCILEYNNPPWNKIKHSELTQCKAARPYTPTGVQHMTMNYELNPILQAKWPMKSAHMVPPKTLVIMPSGFGPAEPTTLK